MAQGFSLANIAGEKKPPDPEEPGGSWRQKRAYLPYCCEFWFCEPDCWVFCDWFAVPCCWLD